VKKSVHWVCEVAEEGDVLYGKAAAAIWVFPQENFSPLYRFRLAHVPANWVLGAHYGNIKWSGSEADHLHFVARLGMWCCTYTFVCVHGMVLNLPTITGIKCLVCSAKDWNFNGCLLL